MKHRRRLYRKALVRVKACLYIGRKVEGDDFTPLEIKLYGLLRHQISTPDLLQARLSSFTPDARRRIALYPLLAKA
jgi:hypothetical protein